MLPVDDVPPLPPEFENTGVPCFLDPDETIEGTVWQATFNVDVGVLAENTVEGNVRVVRNVGEAIEVAENVIEGHLTCSRNNPAPTGGGNLVAGKVFGQCRGL